MLSADDTSRQRVNNLCKQFGPRFGPAKCGSAHINPAVHKPWYCQLSLTEATFFFCCLLIIYKQFGPRSGPTKGWVSFVGSDLDPNCLTVWCYSWNFILKKISRPPKKHSKLPSGQRVNAMKSLFLHLFLFQPNLQRKCGKLLDIIFLTYIHWISLYKKASACNLSAHSIFNSFMILLSSKHF